MWFLQHKKYQHWRQEQKSSLLWVSADPGCGKSVLAKFLVDELKGRESQSILPGTVCFFFCKDDNDEQKSATSALRALLHQLFTTKKSLVRHAMAEFQIKGEKFTEEFGTLWKILTTAATDLGCGNVICVIDGLDECEESTKVQLINSWVDFYSKPNTNKPFLKFIFTSRPYRSIEAEFDDLQTIRLRAEDETDATSEDIELVVKARVQTIGKRRHLTDKVQSALVERLISNADRTFLWVSLILDDLEKGPRVSQGALNDLVSTIPRTLDAVYEKILGQSSEPKYATKLLHIVVAAARPLSLKEMNVAFAIKSSDRSTEDLDLEPDICGTIKDLCGLFVKFIDSKIYLVHQTAKEFLSKKPSIELTSNSDPSLRLWKHSLDPAESNLILAERCVWYLLFSVFENHPLVIDPKRWKREELVNRYTRGHDFLDYAAKHWAAHFQNAKIGEEAALLKSTLEVCDTRSNRFMTWFQVYWITVNTYLPYPQNFTDLMVGSYFGHEAVVRLLLEKSVDVHDKDSRSGRTPLSWAAGRGHEAVVRLLLEKGADVDSKDHRHGQTPLSWAAENGHKAVVRLLLEKGAAVDSKDSGDGRTPLSWAALNGHEAVVRLLLEKGADVDSKDSRDGRTPLSWAAGDGHEVVVRLLLEKGADVDFNDPRDSQTPLWWAAVNGHEAVVRLLLEKGADVDSKSSRHSWTLLLWAAMSGQEAVVRLLLKNGADVDSKDSTYGQTPLSWAAENGHKAVVRLLLEKGADVDSKDSRDGRTPLSWAALNGHEVVVRLLLEKGAAVDSKDSRDGRTPLSWAALNGHEVVVRLLLEKGADVDSKDSRDGRTPLSWAAGNGYRAVVRLLLEKGADVDSKDSQGGWTPLSWAAGNGYAAVVGPLLEKGTDVSSKDGRTQQPLAAAMGHEAVVRLLLEKDADVDSKDHRHGQTPLWWAARSRHKFPDLT
jgi:ankyrin repeat domain-containing protein 50